MRSAPPPTLILAGPTGVGKTELAVRLAERGGYELVSADSMQVYRGIEIGTGQPTPAELRGVPIHCCGMIDAREPFNAKMFVDMADEAARAIAGRGKTPLFVGGTGMYLRALRFGLFDQPDEPGAAALPEIRARLLAELESGGLDPLRKRLAAADPDLEAKIAPRDAVRIIRGLEILEATGRPLSQLHCEWDEPKPRFPHDLLVLSRPRPALVERIERRVDAMLDAGWVQETRKQLDAGVPAEAHCFKALGYAEIIQHLHGRLGADAMRQRIKARTRQFSKRQMTWFRREPGALWIEFGAGEFDGALEKIDKLVEERALLSYKEPLSTAR